MAIQIVYTSVASTPLDDEALRCILDSAIRNNARMNITGLLLYSKQTFLQVLEGDKLVLEQVMTRIQTDRRHSDIDILTSTPIKEREFSQWHMGFRRLGKADAEAWPQYAAFFEAGFNSESIGAREGSGLEILKALAETIDSNSMPM